MTIKQIVYKCLDEINLSLSDGDKLNKSKDELLIGDGGKLDSLALMIFLTDIEKNLKNHLNIDINVLDDKLMSNSNGPYKTIGTFIEYYEKKNEIN